MTSRLLPLVLLLCVACLGCARASAVSLAHWQLVVPGETPPGRAHVGEALLALLDACLELDPTRRPTAREVRDALAAAA